MDFTHTDIDFIKRKDLKIEDINIIKDWILEESDINEALCQPELIRYQQDKNNTIKKMQIAEHLQSIIMEETLKQDYIVFRGTNNIEQERISPYFSRDGYDIDPHLPIHKRIRIL